MGEATHPGPKPLCPDRQQLVVQSHNMSCWHRHADALLAQASRDGVHLLIFQEVNLTPCGVTGASHWAQRQGWQMLVVPAPSSRKGGVAILARKPLGLLEHDRFLSAQSQTLSAQLLGIQGNIHVFAHYSVPNASPDALHSLTHRVEALQGAPWILGLDGNVSMTSGHWASAMALSGGILRAVARHNRGSVPIDGIWSSENSPVVIGSSAERQAGGGDHSIAQASFCFRVPAVGTEWRLSRTANTASECGPGNAPSWTEVACDAEAWTASLQNVDQAWTQWCKDAETWLGASEVVDNSTSERPLGSRPSLRTGNHKVACREGCEERKLRRAIRRLQEARCLQFRGRFVPDTLRSALLRSALAPAESAAVHGQRYGLALSLANQRLQGLLQGKQKKALEKWYQDIHTTRGACRWLRREEATPLLLADEGGEVLTQPATALPALADFWGRTFGCTTDTTGQDEAFWSRYGQYVRQPSVEWPGLAPLDAKELRRVAKEGAAKAGGPDGFTPQMIAWLPDEALTRLADLLNLCEREGRFPDDMLHWKIAFLPKKRQGKIASLGDVRPVAVGPIVYRLWARLRLQAVRDALSTCLLHTQGGGVRGQDAQTLVLSLHLDFPQDVWEYGVMLDYSKAFDSTDWSLCVSLLRRIHMPEAIVALIEYQWRNHLRWLSFGGAVHRTPLKGCKGIPQGDPWAPVVLALLLSLPAMQVRSQVPDADSLLYVDDRSVVAKTRDALLRAVDCWRSLEEVTRLRTNHDKTQFFVRSRRALNECRKHGVQVAESAEMLGVTVGIPHRQRSAEEEARCAKAGLLARRLAHLPLSLKTKAFLAAITFAPKAAWGAVIGGLPLTQKVRSRFAADFRLAVIPRGAGGDRSSRELQRVLLLSHRSDLSLMSLQSTVGALSRWAALKVQHGSDPTQVRLERTPLGSAIAKEFSRFGWALRARRWGVFGDDAYRVWDVRASRALQDKAAHLLRDSWRVLELKAWLAHRTRRDSAVARAAGLRVGPTLVRRLRALAQNQTGDGIAVMCGGASTDAKWTPSGPIFHVCHACGEATVPSLCHVFWSCSFFSPLRGLPCPSSLLAQRLGWGVRTDARDADRIAQMGSIRNAEWGSRRSNPAWASYFPRRAGSEEPPD